MANYYEIPPEYVLAPNPQFQMLSLNHISLLTSELRSERANFIIADPRCNKLKVIMRRGEGKGGESITLLCAPEVVTANVPLEAGMNIHTDTHMWLYKQDCNSKPLSVVSLSEDHHARERLTANFNTYIKLLKPDVVVVSEGVFATGLHERLLDIYRRYCKAQLLNGGNNVLWLYHNPANMAINVAMEVGFGFINIERVLATPDEASAVEAGTANF